MSGCVYESVYASHHVHGQLCVCGGGCVRGGVHACARVCVWHCACDHGSAGAGAGERACVGWCAGDDECGAYACDEEDESSLSVDPELLASS